MEAPSTRSAWERIRPGWMTTLVLAVVVLALFPARDGLAQTSTPRFAGRWAQVSPLVPDGRLPPTVVLQVAVANEMLAVEERLGNTEQHRRPPSSYRLDPQLVDVGVSADRTFRWLAPDRLALHEVAISPRGAHTAVRAVWELREGGRVLRIRRTVRALDGTNPVVRVFTYRRVDQ